MKLDGPQFATLTGLAVGDALGMPFEGMSIVDKPLREWNGWFEYGERLNLQAGQWTDDTQMATALAESLLAEKTYSPADAARRYLAWHTSGDCRGQGGSTGKALRKLKGGYTWMQSATPGSEGNGTAMRIAPLGLFFHGNVDAAARMAAVDARITHGSEEAAVGAMAISVAVAMLAQRSAVKDNLLYKVTEWTGPTKTQVHGRICNALVALNRDISSKDKVIKILIDLGTGGHIVQTVPAALFAFAATTNFRDAVEVAVRAGGDTDTTAAITGALAGTFYGIKEVAYYLEKLEGAEHLRALERCLYAEGPTVY